MLIKIKKPWEIPEREATPESFYLNRRKALSRLGLLGIGAFSALSGMDPFGGGIFSPDRVSAETEVPESGSLAQPTPPVRNLRYVLDRPITKEDVVLRYNNFYEFSLRKNDVCKLVDPFVVSPWTLHITGLVQKEQMLDVDQLIRQMNVEERLYRHRCVEAWAMAVPWMGFPLRDLVNWAQPLSTARFVKFVSFFNPDQAPSQKYSLFADWPYREGLTLEEAMNGVAFIATGLYGKPLPKQNGAPLRLVVPWKYGFKSIKSIVKIEFTDSQPATFWNSAVPNEYDFQANVNPKIPHPRWSQEWETLIDTNEKRKTLPYNGYGNFVASLYG